MCFVRGEVERTIEYQVRQVERHRCEYQAEGELLAGAVSWFPEFGDGSGSGGVRRNDPVQAWQHGNEAPASTNREPCG
jgi:hypothetical protein